MEQIAKEISIRKEERESERKMKDLEKRCHIKYCKDYIDKKILPLISKNIDEGELEIHDDFLIKNFIFWNKYLEGNRFIIILYIKLLSFTSSVYRKDKKIHQIMKTEWVRSWKTPDVDSKAEYMIVIRWRI
jgi:hypothetical protein